MIQEASLFSKSHFPFFSQQAHTAHLIFNKKSLDSDNPKHLALLSQCPYLILTYEFHVISETYVNVLTRHSIGTL